MGIRAMLANKRTKREMKGPRRKPPTRHGAPSGGLTLESHLAQLRRKQASAGEYIPFRVENYVDITLKELAEAPGIRWNGGKPAGLAKAEPMPPGVLLSGWVGEDRR